MARTRDTTAHGTSELPSDRKIAASGKKASAAKSKTAAQPQKVRTHEKGDLNAVADIQKGKKNHPDEDNNGEEDFDIVESEEYDSEDYYPTKIAKKRDSQKLDAVENKPAVNKTSKEAQKQLISEISHKNHKSTRSSLPSSSSKPPAATRIPCVACNDAHAKCVKSDVKGQPCDRCARLGLECVFDPNHKRGGRRPSLGKNSKDKKTTTGQQLKNGEDNGDTSSEDPLNSPAPTIHVASRQTRTNTRSAKGRFAKASRAKDDSPSTSPLSPTPGDSEDELDTTMAGAKQQTNENVSVPSTPNSRSKARTPRSAARKGPSPGIPAPNSNENNTSPNDHDLSPSMTDPVPHQDPNLDDSSILPGTNPVVIESQDKDKEQENSCDDTAVESASNPGSASPFHSASPPRSDTLPADQPTKEFTLASPHTEQNTPTFLPDGHGSVLNPDMLPEQQQQHHSPLPPISQLGPGGAYRGRYDTTTHPQPTISTTPGQAAQVPVMISSQILPAPLTMITHNNHALLSTTQTNTHTNASSSPSSYSYPSYMPPEGSRAYRYSATKILFLLKHSQRAQLLAVGGAYIAPDAIAKLTSEIEDTRTRAMRLWYEVHDGLTLDEKMYDEGGLRFLREFGRNN